MRKLVDRGRGLINPTLLHREELHSLDFRGNRGGCRFNKKHRDDEKMPGND